MSDASQGEGWWLASDGKWYPPQAPTAISGEVPSTGVSGKRRAVRWLVAVLVLVDTLLLGLVVGELLIAAGRKGQASSAAAPASTTTGQPPTTTAEPTTTTEPPPMTTEPPTTTTTTTGPPPPTTTGPPAAGAVHLEGAGFQTVDLDQPIGRARFTARHNGRANFVVYALDAYGGYVDGVFNEIGVFSGSAMAGDASGDTEIAVIEVLADGRWTIDITPLA